MSNKVLFFPKDKLETAPQSLEEVILKIDENQREAVETALDEIVPDLLNHLGSFNFYIQDEKDIGMVLEAIKSGVFRTMNIKHELQDVTDQLIKIV